MGWEASRRFCLERWPERHGDDVKFRLIYDGELPSQARSGVETKHHIRKQLHPQLRNLWKEHQALRGYTEEMPGLVGEVQSIADEYACHGFRFVPLVRQVNGLACGMEILVLMRQEPYHVFSGSGGAGDLDNRIKTLLDGLQKPKQSADLPPACAPAEDEDPFYCLLEDDKSVYDFTVTTDRLLAPPKPGQTSRDVVAIINVHITTVERYEMALTTHGFGQTMTRGFGFVPPR